jgi:hypothetical protein
MLVAAYLLIVVAWVGSNPPGAAPDESSHYIRAAGLSELDMYGEPFDIRSAPAWRTMYTGNAPEGQRAWYEAMTRGYTVQRSIDHARVHCPRTPATTPARCPPTSAARKVDPSPPEGGKGIETIRASYHAYYEPYGYIAPAIGIRAANTAYSAYMLSRLASALLATALIALAAFTLFSIRHPGTLVGLIVAVTPMVVFMGSEIGPNGLEIAGGICLAAGVLRITRGDRRTRGWTAIACGGAALVLARTIGPAWLGFYGLMMLGLLGVRGLVQLLRRSYPVWLVICSLLLIALALDAMWWKIVPDVSAAELDVDIWHLLDKSFGNLSEQVRHQIGTFGYLEVSIPKPAYNLWKFLTVALVTLAFAAGSRRDRLVLAGSFVGVVALSLIFAVYAQMLSGDVGKLAQGRYLLPVVVGIPMLAGEIVHRNRRALPFGERGLFVVAIVVAASVHAVAWGANARRHAVGVHGPIWFWTEAEWTPVGGWTPWVLFGSAAILLMLLSGVLAWRSVGFSRLSARLSALLREEAVEGAR